MRAKKVALAVLVICAVSVVVGITGAAWLSTERTVTATINDKERVCDLRQDGYSGCRYLIFTDQGTFQVTDSFAFGRLRSSDVYGNIRRDRTYSFHVVGFRSPALSTYPNIVSDPIEVPS